MNAVFTIFLGKVTDDFRLVSLILFILVLLVKHFIQFLICSIPHDFLEERSYSKIKSYSLTSSWQDLSTGCRRYSRAARLRSWRRISIKYTCKLPNRMPSSEESSSLSYVLRLLMYFLYILNVVWMKKRNIGELERISNQIWWEVSCNQIE